MGTRSWTNRQLADAVKSAHSYRAVLLVLGLVSAGGNYDQIKRWIADLAIDTTHFTGKGWNTGLKFVPRPAKAIELLLVKGSTVQSYKLKAKLFDAGLKLPQCEKCGWAEQSVDGRTPLELDHINGDKQDNRLENLQILCPNCHSLQPTHRGRNKKLRYARVV